MGKKIDQLTAYGSYDSDKMLSDILEVSKNSGTSGSPIYASGGSRKIKLSDLAILVNLIINAPAKVTSAPTIELLEDDANWTDNNYSGSAIAGQKTGDWYDNGTHRYNFITATTVGRIPYKYL